jgi:histidinol-phosphatase
MALSDDLALAHLLADAADAITLDRYLAQDLKVESKPDATPVTDADRAVEIAIREILSRERSSDHIIGEEFGGSEEFENREGAHRYWVIDPIDGTKNFLRGVPIWATLIALMESKNTVGADANPQLLLGIVSAPALGRRWFASRGGGAFVTQTFGSQSKTRKITVSQVARLEDASLSYSDLIGWGDRRENFTTLLPSLWRTRAIGDFYSHMLVAEGAVDIAAEPSLALWDMAAVAAIVNEAGGTFSSLDGESGPFGKSGLSSNGLLHEQFIKQLNGERK